MDKYEYMARKVQVNNMDRATERLNEYGAEGWNIVSETAVGNSVIIILQRPLQVLRAAVKQAEAKAGEKEAAEKKKAAQERMAKARAAKKAKKEETKKTESA